ncbi:MAG: hypothetical protein JXR61_12080 [Prolixibacteraceae bacterium]|nr:hypothetical protein [Prolixibacteraceae bacterium]
MISNIGKPFCLLTLLIVISLLPQSIHIYYIKVGHPLGDPNRDTRVRILHWTEDCSPDFRQEEGD